MPAIDALLKRFGFIKLARFGLVLTPEGRIMSLRPAVLDDGLGGRIVGWQDGDLAAMELTSYPPARPAPNPAVATRVAVAPPPRPAVIASPPEVAPPAQVEEDEWEWEIALARARVAEQVELAPAPVRAPLRARPTMPPPILDRAPRLAVVTTPAAEPMESWGKTEELSSIDYEDRTSPGSEVVRVARITHVPVAPIPQNDRPPTERPLAAPIGVRKATAPIAIVAPPKAVPAPIPVVRTVSRPGTAPPTAIPIPRLPSLAKSPLRTTQIQPVVRAAAPRRDFSTRLAKGTGPVTGTHIGPPPPPVRQTEDTIPNLAIGDSTKPGYVLPRAAHAVALPSVKRLAR